MATSRSAQLELRLLDPAVRRDRAAVDRLLHPGASWSSGRPAAMLGRGLGARVARARYTGPPPVVSGLRSARLSGDAMLVTYRAHTARRRGVAASVGVAARCRRVAPAVPPGHTRLDPAAVTRHVRRAPLSENSPARHIASAACSLPLPSPQEARPIPHRSRRAPGSPLGAHGGAPDPAHHAAFGPVANRPSPAAFRSACSTTASRCASAAGRACTRLLEPHDRGPRPAGLRSGPAWGERVPQRLPLLGGRRLPPRARHGRRRDRGRAGDGIALCSSCLGTHLDDGGHGRRARRWRSRATPRYCCGGRCSERSPIAYYRRQLSRLTAAEGVGFEPTVRFHGLWFSRPARSTTLPPLRAAETIAPSVTRRVARPP